MEEWDGGEGRTHSPVPVGVAVGVAAVDSHEVVEMAVVEDRILESCLDHGHRTWREEEEEEEGDSCH